MNLASVAALAALASLPACDLVFPSTAPSDEPDAAIPIDAVPDAPVCPGGTAPRTTRAPTVADAVLIDPGAGSAQGFGKVPTINLDYGNGIKSVGIWRFSLAAIPTPLPSWTAARVVLEWLPADDDCGPPACAPCNAFEEPGDFELYPIREGWDEQTVSWTARTSSTKWNEPGAAGTDRGAFTTRATHVPRERLVFPLGPAELAALAPWIANTALSLVVVPKASPNGRTGARMIVPALPPRASCAPPDPPSFLEIDDCE